MKFSASIQRWGLVKIFAFFSLISIITLSIGSAYIFYSFLRDNLLHQEMIISSDFIQSISLINNHESFFTGNEVSAYDYHEIDEFLNHLISMPDVFRVFAYNANLEIIWSSEAKLKGKIFTDNDELDQALRGKRLFKQVITNKHVKQEHDSIPEDVDRFVESYIPVWDRDHREVVGVLEIYKAPRTLFKAISEARVLVIVVTLFGGIMLYWVLFWIVLTAHQLIESQRARIKQATSRAVELNEQNMRRIGSDLHDGPAQSIGFALLRLDTLEETLCDQPDKPANETFSRIQSALRDALQEIRELSAGLVIPELDDLSVKEFILKVIEKHEIRTSTRVNYQLADLPGSLKPATKICIYRLVQEGLNNAYKHGKGIDQSVLVYRENKYVKVIVSDGGPGIQDNDMAKINDSDHLGLRGLRERVESIGGIFKISCDEQSPGASLHASLPVAD